MSSSGKINSSPAMKICRWALVGVVISVLSAKALAAEPTAEEWLKLRIESLELKHLQKIDGLAPAEMQKRNQALEQQDRDFKQRLSALKREQYQALEQQFENRLALALPPLRQKWVAEEVRFEGERRALNEKRGKELEADAAVAAQLQTERTFRQRKLDAKTISQQEFAAQDAADVAKISALQDKYTAYGENWAPAFNRELQQVTERLVRERDLNERLADTSSEVGKDAHQFVENKLAESRTHLRAFQHLITAEQAEKESTPRDQEQKRILAKYDVGGALAAAKDDFNQRVWALDGKYSQERAQAMHKEVEAELAAKQGRDRAAQVSVAQRPAPPPTYAPATPAYASPSYASASGSSSSGGWSIFGGSFVVGPMLSALAALGAIALRYRFVKQEAKVEQARSFDGYLRFAWQEALDHPRRVLAVWICSMVFNLFVGSLIAFLLFLICKQVGYKAFLRKFEKRRKAGADEQAAWFASLGSNHAARAASINEIFDRKSRTVSFTIARDYGITEGNERRKQKSFVMFAISRNLAAMETRERELLRVVELLHSIDPARDKEEYQWAKGALIWGDGKAQISTYHCWIPDYEEKGLKKDDITGYINWYMTKADASVEKAVNATLRRLEESSAKAAQNPQVAPLLAAIEKRLRGGNQWLGVEELSSTPFAKQNEHELHIGMVDGTGHRLTYSGEGSLISIAPPGSGKTQCNVFPTLLTWRGPAVVLDVKGEIYAKTSKWRAANVGPVYRFSPLDPAHSHCYNPLSFVRRETDYIWEDSRFLADMMIVPSGGKDPFWENKARDVLTCAIAHVCYSNPPEQRPMSRVMDIIHGGSAWQEMVLGLQTAVDVRSMMQQGSSLSEMNEKTRDSVLQTAQSSLSAWSGERIARATQKSDWSPMDLRGGTNPTIYICLKPNEVDSYISLLRVFIAQHIRMLCSELPPHGAAPILFLLDELPRLKQMPPVEEAIEIGRQYGLRLWMFAQSLGQLEQAYPNAEGIVGSCAVRIFMNPSAHDGTAEKLSEELGFRESALDGSRQKVVEAAELAGPDYRDYQIVMAASCKPVKVKKAFAWQDAELSARMGSL